MSKEKRHFAIGAFVLCSLTLIILAGILFGGGELFPNKLYFETYFDASVQGLDVGSAVKLRGVTVGKVEEISFARQTYFAENFEEENIDVKRSFSYVRILCSLDLKKHPGFSEEHIEGLKTLGLSATLAMQGITGGMLINLDFASDPAPKLCFNWTPKEIYIPSRPTQLENVLNIAEKIANNIEKIDFSETISAITTLTDTVSQAVENAQIPRLTESCLSLVNSLNDVTTEVKAGINTLNLKEVSTDLKSITSHIANITATLDEVLPNLAQSSSTTLSSVQESLSALNGTLAQVSTILTTIITDVDIGELSTDVENSLEGLSRTISALEALINQLRERPSRILFDDEQQF